MLTLADLGEDAGLGAAALEALQSALQRLIFTNTNFRHFIFPSLRRGGASPVHVRAIFMALTVTYYIHFRTSCQEDFS